MNDPELKMILFRTVISGEETKKKKKKQALWMWVVNPQSMITHRHF